MRISMRWTGAKVGGILLASGAVLAACGSSTPASVPAAAPATTSAASSPTTSAAVAANASGATVAEHSGPLGTYLTDSSGRTLYMFEADKPGKSNCSAACLAVWPAYTTNGSPKAGNGVDQSKLGTTTDADGKMIVTYNGWPLYYFASDSAAGQTSGQGVNGFGALWWVIGPSGSPITSSSAAPSTAPATSSAKGGSSWS